VIRDISGVDEPPILTWGVASSTVVMFENYLIENITSLEVHSIINVTPTATVRNITYKDNHITRALFKVMTLHFDYSDIKIEGCTLDAPTASLLLTVNIFSNKIKF